MTEMQSSECPFSGGGTSNREWWPDQIDVSRLREKSTEVMGEGFDYGSAFSALDLDEVKREIESVMTTSQDWWPADYGNYGPFFIRMAWHSAGTYRISDGRGGAGAGMQRFAPLNSWPDNANLDKARRLLWPVKKKFGSSLSWADLIILAGNVALESMGFTTFGFAGGREDVWESDDTYWGSETAWLADERYSNDRELEGPLAAVQMGLIYVNPEGPNGEPDPLAAAQDIRETFRRMAMDDEETVALIAGGHTFGKVHGAAPPDGVLGPEPEAAPLQAQGLGWISTYGTGSGADTITSGLEGAWTNNPVAWDNGFFANLFDYEWELTTSPAGAKQWKPKNGAGADSVPDAHRAGVRHAPMMLTTDLALRFDPVYEQISRRFYADPQEFADVFARAWFKLTHRDMGPYARGLGAEVPPEPQLWQDPSPVHDGPTLDATDIAYLQNAIDDSGLSVRDLVWTAWASASTFRITDKRGGANGARVTLEPQRSWEANDPATVSRVIKAFEGIQSDFNASTASRTSGSGVSLADLIVLGGAVAIERAAAAGGSSIEVPFVPGRTDATPEQTDAISFEVLEPVFDGFRNHVVSGLPVKAEALLVEKASLLGLTAREMTALIGGLRVLGITSADNSDGVFTSRPGELTNDFFTNLLDIGTEWAPLDPGETRFVGIDRISGEKRYTASRVDLVFGSNSILRGICEVYGASDGNERLVADFVAAWDKVMSADRFDLKRQR